MSQQGKPTSVTTSETTSTRNPRIQNKIPKEQMTTIEVNALGFPMAPRKVVKKFTSSAQQNVAAMVHSEHTGIPRRAPTATPHAR
uniref:Uncharacterized protein n=1 Tax=Oryza punctata TaxID=4537 RepID=A0A0E0M680_ORYPU